MKKSKHYTNFKFWLTILLFSIFSIGNGNGQEVDSKKDSIPAEPIGFAVSEIPGELNKLSNYLTNVSQIIEVEEKIIDNDTITIEYSVLLEESKQEIIENLPTMTYQQLENLLRAWFNYKNKFDLIQETLKDRINEIELIENKLIGELQKWETMALEIDQKELPEELKNSVNLALLNLNSILDQTNERSDSLLLMSGKQTKLILVIDEMIHILQEEQKVFQSNYFIIDASPIWSISDSTIQFAKLKSYVGTESAESYGILKIFLKSNKIIVFLQIIFVIFLIVGFILLSKIWTTEELDKNSTRETRAGYIIRRPFFSSLLISIIISLFFYQNRPVVLVDFFMILMLISSIVLLPGLYTKKIRIPLILTLILICFNVIQDFLPYQSFAIRINIILQSIAVFGILLLVNRIKNEFELKSTGKRVLNIFFKVFIFLLAVAFISNVIGAVKLAEYLMGSIAGTLNFSAIVLTIIIILNSMIILLIKAKKAQSIPLYEQLRKLIDSRIRPLINWGGLILWLYGVLGYFRLYTVFKNWIGGVMATEFMVASVAISVGGIISFLLIVFFTYILVRLINNIFKDEWITKSNLPRGTAATLSMVIRYTIVAFGIYLALHSVGLKLDKLGFLAGALGIGIGFGLQNIVLNFIAGLILTFENPIHVGDVIEVDQYMGRVTEIGARASKVLTWDGSEVIVPNGLLISNKVVNWTLTNQKRRLNISIKTPFDANPEKVIEILTEVASKHPNTLNQPAPMAIFNGYESSAFDFTIYCWVEFNVSLTTKSDIAMGANKALAAAGIAAPLYTQKIRIDQDIDLHSKD